MGCQPIFILCWYLYSDSIFELSAQFFFLLNRYIIYLIGAFKYSHNRMEQERINIA